MLRTLDLNMLRDLTGQRCIVDRGADMNVSRKWNFRRGLILESRIHFGKPRHKVRMERRGRERTYSEVWIPQSALRPLTGKNLKLYISVLHGRDDA